MPSPIKVFSKCIETNQSIDYAINTFIAEYDIKSAHATALYFIKGKEVYDELMKMEKLARNTTIGCMIRDEPGLHDKIAALLLQWFNKFCEVNVIKEQNFISSTRDSILLVNKKPIKTTLEDGKVLFRNKDGEFTSYIRINNLEILFDSVSYNLRIKGINKEYVESNPVFIRLFKQLLTLVEDSKNLTAGKILKKANLLRNKYINSKDPMMFASILDGNNYVYYINGEKVLSRTYIDDFKEENGNFMQRHDNYVNLFLPVLKICFKPH